MRCVALFVLTLLLAIFNAAPGHAERRVALVIGNGTYNRVARLPNPANDADAMAALFRDAGFDVVETRRNFDIAVILLTLRDFSDHVRDADIAVLFFAGHGIEINGENHLIPVDATLERDINVEDETISLDRVSQMIEPARRL